MQAAKEDISYRNILRVAVPIMVGGIGHVAIIVGDTVMLGRVGAAELGAAGNAGLLYFMLAMVGMGFATGTQIIIGRRNGEKNYHRIGPLMSQSFYFLMLLAALFYAFLRFGSPWLMGHIGESPQVAAHAVTYLQSRSWGIFFSMISAIFVAFFTGIARTRAISFGMAGMAMVNLFLDYCLIFGNLGFPEMGVEGAALASAIAEAATAIFYILFTILTVNKQKYNLFHFPSPKPDALGRIWKVGGPVMLQNFVTMGGWFGFFTIIEHMGERELAISHIARSVYSVLMIPAFSFGNSANTLTSNLLGQGTPALVIPLLKRTWHLSLLFCIVAIQPCLWAPVPILSLYTADFGLAVAAVPTLYVICGAIFFLATASVLFQGVTGTGNTRLALGIESLNIIIYLSFCYTIVMVFHVSVEAAWCSEFLYFGLMGLMCLLYLHYGKWTEAQL